MKMTLAVFAVAAFAALALAGACGGRQMLDLPPDADGGAGGAPIMPTVGPIDLSQAPETLSMKCGAGIGTITFVDPCLIGARLTPGDASSPGSYEVECAFATPARTVGWSFLVTLPPLENPETLLPLTPTAVAISLANGQMAIISGVNGALTFSRVDPTNRAFAAVFNGTVTWEESTGASFSCTVATKLWGAPGTFN